MPAIGPRIPAQGFGIDQHLTILPVAAPPQLIHCQANAAPSEINDAMATRLFYQGKKLHSLINGGATSSLFRTAGTAHAEHKATTQGVETSILATNEPGSVVQTHTSHGQAQLLSYSAYGAIQTELTKAQALLFNGEWREPLTGGYPLGNGYRIFSPQLMRFHSPDSLSPFSSGGINAYAYCEGDPINYIDPLGHVRVKTVPRHLDPLRKIAPISRPIQKSVPGTRRTAVVAPQRGSVIGEPARTVAATEPASSPANRATNTGPVSSNRAPAPPAEPMQIAQPTMIKGGYRTQLQVDNEADYFSKLFNSLPSYEAKLIAGAHVYNLAQSNSNLKATRSLGLSATSRDYKRIQYRAPKMSGLYGHQVLERITNETRTAP